MLIVLFLLLCSVTAYRITKDLKDGTMDDFAKCTGIMLIVLIGVVAAYIVYFSK
jgi:hypothetical protein